MPYLVEKTYLLKKGKEGMFALKKINEPGFQIGLTATEEESVGPGVAKTAQE